MPASPIQLVIFDLGRVLIRICDSWQHAAEAAKYAGRLPEMTPQLQAALHELVILSETAKIDDAEFCQRVGQAFAIDAAHVNQLADAYLLGPFVGVSELIDDLKAAGVRTACLSNTNSNHWQQMTAESGPNALPLHKLDYRFASHLVGLRKPDAAIYKHVEQATGVRAMQIVFFDDLPDNIGAATARGWNAVQITDRNDPVSQMRDALRRFKVV